MKLLWQFLKSKKLSMFIIVYCIIISLLGVCIPQLPEKSFAGWQSFLWEGRYPILAGTLHALYLDRVFASFWIYILGVGLLINVISCTVEQVLRQRGNLTGVPLKEVRQCHLKPEILQQILVNKGFRVLPGATNEPDRVILDLEKNRIGRWGAVIFHLGIILVVAGVFSGSFTRFEGILNMTEGKTVFEDKTDYNTIAHYGILARNHKGFGFTVKRIDVEYPRDDYPWVSRTYCEISENGSTVVSRGLGEKENLQYRGCQFYQTGDWGYSVGIRVVEKGRAIFNAFLVLDTQSFSSGRQEYSRSYNVPGQGTRLSVSFIPNVLAKGGQTVKEGLSPTNPAVALRMEKSGKKLFNGIVRLGEVRNLGGYQSGFLELRRWRDFRVTRDISVPVIFSGYWVGLCGIVLYLFCIPQRVRLITENGSITRIYYWSRRLKKHNLAIFTELVRDAEHKSSGGGTIGC